MGISTITNLNPLAISRPEQADFEPLPMARVENSANAADDSYSPGGGGSAGGAEDGEAGNEFDGQLEDIAGEVAAASAGEQSPATRINVFA